MLHRVFDTAALYVQICFGYGDPVEAGSNQSSGNSFHLKLCPFSAHSLETDTGYVIVLISIGNVGGDRIFEIPKTFLKRL